MGKQAVLLQLQQQRVSVCFASFPSVFCAASGCVSVLGEREAEQLEDERKLLRDAVQPRTSWHGTRVCVLLKAFLFLFIIKRGTCQCLSLLFPLLSAPPPIKWFNSR